MVSNNRIDKLSNFAIHTDLCSPLATDPAWGVLRLKHPQAHEDLRQGGVSLWRSLITDWLKPNIILVSTREEYLSDVIKKPVSEWDKLMPPIKQNADGSSRKKGPYSVKYCVVSFDHEKDHEKAVVVYAPFDQVPFNVYCKREIGKQIKEKYEGLF